MSQLVFDIETVGEKFDDIDPVSQEMLTRWIRRESESEADYAKALDDLKNRLGFSPVTGEIVAIGVFDLVKNQGVVYFQTPNTEVREFTEGEFTFKPMGEREMLEHFWQGVANYREFISFNGRAFDAPFLMIRSAIHKVRPSVNLMPNRYLDSAYSKVMHVDLLDQLTFYGAVRRKPNLHLWCRAFGIESPKAGGVSGDDVGPLFQQGKFTEIARYNAGDLRATKMLYEYWQNYLRFG